MPFRGDAEPATSVASAEKKILRTLGALCVLEIALSSVGCGGAGLFRQYEYEEEMYLSLDGTATMYVNASIAALDALRGASFDTNPSAPVDRDRVRAYFSTPNTQVTWVRQSRRSGRRFVHVRVEVGDVARLSEAPPFAWSSYRFAQADNLFIYRQTVGPPEGRAAGDVGWTGREIVAFRLHLPSRIEYHTRNPRDPDTDNYGRGNILVWEQSLADRLRGAPLEFEARMQTQSILYRALWLFAVTVVAVAVGFGLIIWWVVRRGAPGAQARESQVSP